MFTELKAQNPWPQHPSLDRVVDLNLDGGGREMLQKFIVDENINLMLEVGSFLGGSARQWLTASPKLNLICVDPWSRGLATSIKSLRSKAWAAKVYTQEDVDFCLDVLSRHAPLELVASNLSEFKDRVVLIQDTSPEIFAKLEDQKVRPDLIYIDTTKTPEHILVPHYVFPRAIIAGDDWSWRNPIGEMPVRRPVIQVARERKAKIYAVRQTFIVAPKGRQRSIDRRYEYAEVMAAT